jgi:hypothetical protein
MLFTDADKGNFQHPKLGSLFMLPGVLDMARPSLTGCPCVRQKNGLKCQGHLRPTKTSATL